MDYQLFVVRGRSASAAIKLADGVTTVGRHDECQLRIKSSQVSRRHCEIFEKKGLLLVKDLGSSNGTFVNGERIKDQLVLQPGDELTVGQVTLRVAKIGESAPPAGRKAEETAVGAAATPAGSAEDEFELDFDEPAAPVPAPAAAPPKAAAAAPAASPDDEPLPVAPEDQPDLAAPDHAVADDAVADFLFNIKIDEDE